MDTNCKTGPLGKGGIKSTFAADLGERGWGLDKINAGCLADVTGAH